MKSMYPLVWSLKKWGQQLPTTHLSDPQQIFRQLKLANFFFNWLTKKLIRLMPIIPTLVTAHSLHDLSVVSCIAP
jgi:hypothetical protein